MLDPTELNARGTRARQALDILRTVVTAPQQALVVAYVYATFSNLMRALEQDASVFPGYFGSGGAELPEINPFSGVVMPAPLSNETPPFIVAPAPLNPPNPPPDQPPPAA